MNNLFLLFTFVLFGIMGPDKKCDKTNQDNKVTTYYLIRHAEKDRSDSTNRDPDLNAEGLERAKKWAEVLKDIELDAVYSTNYKRTIQTGTPVAESKGLEVQNYNAGNLYDSDFQKATRGKTVLVVGHSNTTPQFANAILKQPKYSDLSDSENGALFIVQVLPDGKASSQVLYIN